MLERLVTPLGTFSELIYNTVRGTLAILLVTQFTILIKIKEVKDAPV